MFAVVLDRVATDRNLARQRRVKTGLLTNDEECRARLMRVEQIKNARRYFGIRAVVNRDRDAKNAIGGRKRCRNR